MALTITLTCNELDALDSIFKRSQDDWLTYRNSGHGPVDFPNAKEWRDYVRTVDADHRQVHKLISRISRASRTTRK